MPNPPVIAYDAAYAEDHAAGDASPERELWRAVLRLAADDLFSSNERIRQDARGFFQGTDLLQVMAYAAIDRDLAPWLRRRAKQLVKAPPEPRQPNGKRITFRGQTHSVKEWAKLSGISVYTLGPRLRHGWSITQALTTPGQRRTVTVA